MSNWVGQTLGKVRISSLLARGGTAEVYVGTHTTLQREVAIKVLHSNYDDHPHALERFQREAMVVAKLRHPNIVQVFDFDTVDSHPYLVMEYIKGPSLLKYLSSLHAKGERLDFPHVIRLMNAMTSALQYAHDTGVVHRDIKPGNILLSSRSSDITPGKPLPEDFEPVLTDFGLVRFIDSTQHTTGSGQIAGTPAYMSPEQARGELTDGRTDIYSLGIVLYEILAGHLPFEGETTMGVLMKHINEPPKPIPGLPPRMQHVLDRALAKGLDDRFQTPAEFGQAFTAAVENKNDFSTLDLMSATTKKPAKRLFGKANKQPPWIAPALAALVVVAVGAAFLLSSFRPQSPGPTPATETITISPSPSATITRTPPAMIVLGRTGTLQFEDEDALADQVSLVAEALLSPPPGNQYEVWLVNGKERISLGILTLDGTGKGTLTFKDPDGLNLISLYNAVEVTIESDPDSDPEPSGIIAYSFTLPAEGLTHVRYLLASFPTTPNQTPLIQGLYTDIKLINDLASEMQTSMNNANEAHVRLNAEQIRNIIVGDQSSNHIDSDNNGQVDDPSDGFGLLLNGTNLGYLPAVYTEADSAVSSPGASQQMMTHGEGLKITVQNLGQWTPELQELIAAILSAPQGAITKQQVAEVVALTNKMLNGIDLDEDGRIDAQPGEGGAQVAYAEAYRMVDMPLQPVGILNLGTGTPTFLAVPATSSGGGSDPEATPRIPPGQQNNPGQPNNPPGQNRTREPNGNNNSTTNDSNNGNGNGGNP